MTTRCLIFVAVGRLAAGSPLPLAPPSPCGPCGPVDPGDPFEPAFPAAPDAPCVPDAPAEPAAPAAPVAPCAPDEPAGPAGPELPLQPAATSVAAIPDATTSAAKREPTVSSMSAPRGCVRAPSRARRGARAKRGSRFGEAARTIALSSRTRRARTTTSWNAARSGTRSRSPGAGLFRFPLAG